MKKHSDNRNTEGALKWITGILNKHNIPFRISGGFAARIYGSKRELADIDIGMREDYFKEILPEIEQYFTHKPEHYKDEEWDMIGSTLVYGGQEIDLYPISALKFLNKQTNQWEDLIHTFQNINIVEIYEIKVPIIAKEYLIDYKQKLGREVDIIDVQAMLKEK